jgi:hypothetical protein
MAFGIIPYLKKERLFEFVSIYISDETSKKQYAGLFLIAGILAKFVPKGTLFKILHFIFSKPSTCRYC